MRGAGARSLSVSRGGRQECKLTNVGVLRQLCPCLGAGHLQLLLPGVSGQVLLPAAEAPLQGLWQTPVRQVFSAPGSSTVPRWGAQGHLSKRESKQDYSFDMNMTHIRQYNNMLPFIGKK